MTIPPAGDPGTAHSHKAHPTDDDDMSTGTAQAGTGTPPKEKKMNEYVVRLTHTSKDTTNAAAIFAHLHAMLLHALLEAHGSAIRIYSRANVRIEQVPVAEWVAKLTHAKHFTIHQYKMKEGATKYVIQHRVYFNDSFAKLKRPLEVMKILRENNIRMSSHKWTEDVTDTVQPLFILGINPHHTSDDGGRAHLKSITGARIYNKLPKFKLVPTKLHINTKSGTRISADVFAIEIRQSHRQTLFETLEPLFKDGTTDLLPARLRHNKTDAFANAVRKQASDIANTYVVPAYAITPDMMMYMEDRLKSINGVTHILPAHNNPATGRYNILVKRKLFREARNILETEFHQALNDVASDAEPPEGTFPTVPYLGGKARDEDSEGEDSYMSASIASFQSLAWSESSSEAQKHNEQTIPAGQQSTPPSTVQFVPQLQTQQHTHQDPTYAQATKLTPGTSFASSLTQSPGDLPPWAKSLMDAQAQQAQLQAQQSQMLQQMMQMLQFQMQGWHGPAGGNYVPTPPGQQYYPSHPHQQQMAPTNNTNIPGPVQLNHTFQQMAADHRQQAQKRRNTDITATPTKPPQPEDAMHIDSQQQMEHQILDPRQTDSVDTSDQNNKSNVSPHGSVHAQNDPRNPYATQRRQDFQEGN